MGFTDVEVGDTYDWWTCGGDDEYSTSFTATNVKGNRVEGAVCCGLWKDCTVRFE